MQANDLVHALKEVPEARLRLLELARGLVGEDGRLDPDKAAFQSKEIAEAIEEAHAYGEATRRAVRCLREMARS